MDILAARLGEAFAIIYAQHGDKLAADTCAAIGGYPWMLRSYLRDSGIRDFDMPSVPADYEATVDTSASFYYGYYRAICIDKVGAPNVQED